MAPAKMSAKTTDAKSDRREHSRVTSSSGRAQPKRRGTRPGLQSTHLGPISRLSFVLQNVSRHLLQLLKYNRFENDEKLNSEIKNVITTLQQLILFSTL
jgi:hypothetical protein